MSISLWAVVPGRAGRNAREALAAEQSHICVGGIGHVVPIMVAYHPWIGTTRGKYGIRVGGCVGGELAPCKASQGGIQQQLRQAEHGEKVLVGGEGERRQSPGVDACRRAWRSRCRHCTAPGHVVHTIG